MIVNRHSFQYEVFDLPSLKDMLLEQTRFSHNMYLYTSVATRKSKISDNCHFDAKKPIVS